MTAIFALTVRQLAGSRRLWLVLGLVSLPVLAAVVFRAGDSTTTSDRFADDVTRTLVASAILPLVMLLFATSAFGNELVDRTLGYLALKPVARWRIVLPKLAAAFVVGGIPVAVSGFLAVALVGGGGAVHGALATGVGLLVGAAGEAPPINGGGVPTPPARQIGRK
jgi:ABC-2 type transport system permease protein